MYIVFRSFWARTISIFFVIQAWPCPVATYKLSNLLSIVPSISTEWFTLRFHQNMQLGNPKNEASKSWGKSPNSMRTPCFLRQRGQVFLDFHHLSSRGEVSGDPCIGHPWSSPQFSAAVYPIFDGCLFGYHALSPFFGWFTLMFSFLNLIFWWIRHGFCSCLRPIHYGKMRKIVLNPQTLRRNIP